MLVKVLHLATNKELEERGHIPHEYRLKNTNTKRPNVNQLIEITEHNIIYSNYVDTLPPNPKRLRILVGLCMCEIIY